MLSNSNQQTTLNGHHSRNFLGYSQGNNTMLAYYASHPATTVTITPAASLAQKNARYATNIKQLIDSFAGINEATNIAQLLRDSINFIDDAGDTYRRELTQKFLPVLVNSTASHGIADRYAVLLCGKLVGRSYCDELANIAGFITYIQRAMENQHTCIARPACDAMMKLVAYAPVPEQIIAHVDIDPKPLIRVAVENLSSKADANRCLDAIRVLTILNNASKLSPDNILCEHLVETFYENKTPFVSKQTAGLILMLAAADDAVKLAVTRMLVDGAAENKPIQAAKCWQEVNDVMAFVAH